jgi:hypothetical protein
MIREAAGIDPFSGIFNYCMKGVMPSTSEGNPVESVVYAPLLKGLKRIKSPIASPTFHRKRENSILE